MSRRSPRARRAPPERDGRDERRRPRRKRPPPRRRPPHRRPSDQPPASGPFVRIGQPKNITGNVDARTLRNALATSYTQLNNCYVNGIKDGDKAQAYTADMQVKLGTQSSATMGIPDFLAKTGQCVMNTATSALTSVNENGSADVPIEFVP